MTSWKSAALLALGVASGCSALLGLDDFTDAPSDAAAASSTTSASSSSAGATGGAGSGSAGAGGGSGGTGIAGSGGMAGAGGEGGGTPSCDPLAQNCPMGQACYPDGVLFACATDQSGALGAYGDACMYINACDPKLFCANPSAVDGCTAQGCCSSFCNLTDADPNAACAPSQMCIPWFDPDPAPMGLEHVGVCVLS